MSCNARVIGLDQFVPWSIHCLDIPYCCVLAVLWENCIHQWCWSLIEHIRYSIYVSWQVEFMREWGVGRCESCSLTRVGRWGGEIWLLKWVAVLGWLAYIILLLDKFIALTYHIAVIAIHQWCWSLISSIECTLRRLHSSMMLECNDWLRLNLKVFGCRVIVHSLLSISTKYIFGGRLIVHSFHCISVQGDQDQFYEVMGAHESAALKIEST